MKIGITTTEAKKTITEVYCSAGQKHPWTIRRYGTIQLSILKTEDRGKNA